MLLTAHAFDPENWKGIWSASTAYVVGDVVFSNGVTDSNSLVLRATAITGTGTTGATEPTWAATGGTVVDNEVTWETLGTISELVPITNYWVQT